jgi:hypothetical protein
MAFFVLISLNFITSYLYTLGMKLSHHITVFFSLFSVLFFASFSFPFQVLPNVGGWLEPFFNNLTDFVGVHVFGYPSEALTYHSGEDALGMFVNTFNIVLISLCTYGFMAWKFNCYLKMVYPYCIIYLRYFLALMLLIYGFDKIYKHQFYYPEPNILYTRLKDVPQDLLYWSTMGTSYSYSFFAGLMEVIPAILLFWRRTYVVGAVVALLVFTNVFMTNIGFDITVKIFSFFLLLASFVLLIPNLHRLFQFFIGNDSKLAGIEIKLYSNKFYLGLKSLVILLFIIESQFKYFANMNFNDDLKLRPELHGAYSVLGAQSSTADWSMIYFHRHGYFIVELKNGAFYDYKLDVDSQNNVLQLRTYQGETSQLEYLLKNDTLVITSGKDFQVTAVREYKYESIPN